MYSVLGDVTDVTLPFKRRILPCTLLLLLNFVQLRFKVRIITSRAHHALFIHNMLIRPCNPPNSCLPMQFSNLWITTSVPQNPPSPQLKPCLPLHP
jgi:hypothetical protein